MKTHLQSTLENSKNYTLAVAEAMPENLYNFKPAAEVWTFNELMNHIAYGIQWWEDNYIKNTKAKWNPPAARVQKKETITLLQQCFDDLQKTLDNEKVSDESIKGFWVTLDHVTHHRGQAILHLRMNGITAPEYVF